VAAPHLFGGSLNVHPHLHTLSADGVFEKTDEGGVRFHEIPPGGALVDGGTDAGVMRLAGEAREEIGVAASGTIKLPGNAPPASAHAVRLEPHHTHVVMVPGERFGEASPWIADVAGTIAGDRAWVRTGGRATPQAYHAGKERDLAPLGKRRPRRLTGAHSASVRSWSRRS
jgi:hypothetical protein